MYKKSYKTKILLIYFEKEYNFVKKLTKKKPIYFYKTENYLTNYTTKYFHKTYLFNVNIIRRTLLSDFYF